MAAKRVAYLTIDDSPTRHTDALTDFLVREGVPAVFYCIGSAYHDMHLDCEGIEQNPDVILNAVAKGFVLGNHTYTHPRCSELTYEEVVEQIEKTEKLIESVYARAKVTRPVKLMRFPHLDRGTGGWVVDYDAKPEYRDRLLEVFFSGLNLNPARPSQAQIEKKYRIQDYLAREGFTADVFPGVTLPWYANTEMAQARDSLMTFSTADWMLNPDFTRYAGAWPHRTLDALKHKIDADPDLQRADTTHIILAHDHNGLFETTTALVAHMKQQGFEFRAIQP